MRKAKETIWITGASGFLGARLVRHFSTAGYRVVGLSRRESAAEESLQIDLSSANSIQSLDNFLAKSDGPDLVIHAASKQPGSGELSDFVSSNVQTTRRLVEALSTRPPRKLIYTSTQSVYHRPATLAVKEDAPAGGTLPYSATKRWAEQVLESMKNKTDVVVLRLPSLYGKGQADSFVDGLARRALLNESIELFSRGETVRDALHVSEVVKAIEICLRKVNVPGYGVLNLGCGRPITASEYAGSLVEALGSKSEIVLSDRPSSNPSFYGDIERANSEIDFTPRPLSESMKEYADELRT